MENPLELATAEELMGELFGRFNHAIFAGTFQRSEDCQRTCMRIKGSLHVAAGLAAHVSLRAIDTLESSINELPDGNQD